MDTRCEQRLHQRRGVVATLVPDAVDEEGRRPGHAAPRATGEVIADSRQVPMILQVSDEALHVGNTDRERVPNEASLVKQVLVFEEPIAPR
jgi:hypothetical protein